jgi:2-aminobenzoate-CoA ligase
MGIPPAVRSAADTFAQSLMPPKALWPVFDYSAEHLRHYPRRLNVTAALLDAAVASGHGDKVMLHYGDVAWTYGLLLDRVQRITRVLTEVLRVHRGECVLLRSRNSPMMAACWLAVMRAGAIAVPASPMLRAQELAFIVDKLHIRLALSELSAAAELETILARSDWLGSVKCFTDLGELGTDAELDALAARQAPGGPWADTAADDIAAVLFSSGTTGAPKAVAHFHRDLLAVCDCWRYPLPIAPDEPMCATSSMAFAYGLTSNLLYPLRFHTSSVLLPAVTPELLLTAIERYRIAALVTVPTVLHKLLPLLRSADASSLAKCFSSAEPLLPELWRAWRDATGIRIIQGYGSSEFLSRVLSPSVEGEPVGSLGRAVPGFTAHLVDEQGEVIPPGGRGFLAVRGPTGCRYLGDEQKQRDFVRNGWNVTSDVFDQDADGCFWYVGRKDDIIVSSGYNISAMELEQIVADHPKVLECAVVGVPDQARGMIVRACVVLRKGEQASEETAREIQNYVKASIAPYKYPRDVRFLDRLPRTPSGKIEKYRLREN